MLSALHNYSRFLKYVNSTSRYRAASRWMLHRLVEGYTERDWDEEKERSSLHNVTRRPPSLNPKRYLIFSSAIMNQSDTRDLSSLSVFLLWFCILCGARYTEWYARWLDAITSFPDGTTNFYRHSSAKFLSSLCFEQRNRLANTEPPHGALFAFAESMRVIYGALFLAPLYDQWISLGL